MKKILFISIVLCTLVGCTQSKVDKICGSWSRIFQEGSTEGELVLDFSKTRQDGGDLKFTINGLINNDQAEPTEAVTLRCTYDGSWRIKNDTLYIRTNPTSLKVEELDFVTGHYVPDYIKQFLLKNVQAQLKKTVLISGGILSFEESSRAISFKNDNLIVKNEGKQYIFQRR